MAEIIASSGCKRSDGREWRCGRPVADGKSYCEAHIQQAQLRQKRQPVPDHLKLERTKRTQILLNLVQGSDDGVTEVPVRRKRKMTSPSEDVSDVPKKRAKKVNKEDSVVMNLKMGRMEIAPADSSSSQRKSDSPAIKVGAPATSTVFRRPIRSKNCEPVPVPVVKSLPNIKENVKASAKKINKQKKTIKEKKIIKTKKIKEKIVRKCHWCRLTSFCVLVKCLTCKKNFFCDECINKRYHCKKTIERECPVCQGECPCQTCTRGKPKQVKTKDSVVYDVDEDVIICDPEMETTGTIHEKPSDFEKSQQLHMIQELLPVMSKMNLEKIIELDTEAQNNKGLCHNGLEVQLAGYTEKKECRVCKACIPDAHRSCDYCSFILCLACCHDHRDGYLHASLENLKETKKIRSKSLKNKPWRFCSGARISCPPKNLGGCERGLLHLTSFYPFSLTKDLEESAKRILCNFPLKKLNGLCDSSTCMLCDENGEAGLYFSTKQEFKDNHLEHFMQHWGKGKPVVIRDVFQTQPDLDWDFVFILCEYLEKSASSRNNTETRAANSSRDWCDVELGKNQIFSGGITYENAWTEFLKFKLRFSFDFLQDHFPDHFNAVIRSLPIQEYMNPYMGFMNLGAHSPHQTKNPNLGSYVSLSYGGLENAMDPNLLVNLRLHAYDVVNALVHASDRPLSESSLTEVKISVIKYNLKDHLKSSKKIAKRNKLEGLAVSTSRVDDEHNSDIDVDLTSSRLEDMINREIDLLSDDSESESDDEDLSQAGDTCGAHWDIFCREDVPMLLEFLRKYSDKLNRSRGSPKKVVHPLFDEVFYLDDVHKMKLKEEFNVVALSFEQHIGDAVIIPAGCPYQMRKVKSCANVVHEFMSPESALSSIQVSDEVRLLPVKHKAKGNMVQVKTMAIGRMQAAVEAMHEVFVSQPEWSWPLIISYPAKPPS